MGCDLDALLACAKFRERLTVVWGSALTGEGLPALLDWCVDALIERSRARLEREMNGAGVTAWQPYVKPASFYADAARRGARASRAAALGGR